jgi:putative FmdB family regulatory protein
MPLYKYTCGSCGNKFERLARASQRDDQNCSGCGSKASREEVEAFAVKATIDPKDKVVQTSKEIDIVVGRDAEKRWGAYEDKRRERRAGMVEIDAGASAGGGASFDPGKLLGGEERKDSVERYTQAVRSGSGSLKQEWPADLKPAT